MRKLHALFAPDKAFLKKLKTLIGFYPGNPELYKLAFKNKSARERDNSAVMHNNERLEYLGDAILDSVIAFHLFRQYPYKSEGFLTEMRSKIVSRQHLNKLALKLGLGAFIEAGGENMSKSIYGDTFEALVGAIFLDKGFRAVQKFVVDRILRFHVDVEELESTVVNFKGLLIDWGQREKKEIKFEVVEEEGARNDKRYQIAILVDGKNCGQASDFSKKKAEQKGAEIAFKSLGLMGQKDEEGK